MSVDNISAPTILASNKSIQEATWSGSLPIVISLAPTSISSPTPPRPIHKMVARVSFLHLALHDEVMFLSSYAPTHTLLASKFDGLSVAEPPDPGSSSGDNNNNKGDTSPDDNTTNTAKQEDANQTKQSINNKHDVYPECWFEDEESGTPLRWNLFGGVLYDLMKGKSIINKCSSPSSSTSWKDKLNQHNFLPWRIRVHFTSYPTDDIILPLNDGCNIQTDNSSMSNQEHITTILRSIYRNSLKQALFMQYNSSKVAMSITKNSHEKIWDAVLQSNYTLYNEVNVDLQSGISSPAISSTVEYMVTSKDEDIPQLIPIRVMLNGKTAMQRPIRHEKESKDIEQKRPIEILEELGTSHAPPFTTLGDVLVRFLPNHFNIDSSSGWVSIASDTTLYYSIQGVQPGLKCAMVDIWRALSHPDHFLYLIIVVNE